MIKILLYNEKAVKRIIERLGKTVPSNRIRMVTKDTIWLDNMYLSFSAKNIIINCFGKSTIANEKMELFLKKMLRGEEFCVFYGNQTELYINELTDSMHILPACVGGACETN